MGCRGLFLEQAGVAGNALPLAHVEDPCVGKAAAVIIRLALIRTRSMIRAGNHRCVAKEVHLDVGNGCSSGFEKRVFDVGQKLLLVADFAIVLGIDEAARNQLIEGLRVAINLRLIPQTLQDQQLAFTRIGLLRDHGRGAEKQQKTATDGASLAVECHGPYTSPSSPREGER